MARAIELEAALRPAEREAVQRMVAALFIGLVAREDGEDTRQQIGLYAGELARFPLFAVAAACRGYRQADEKFRPALGELTRRAREAAAAPRAEHARIVALLGARVERAIDAGERERVRDGLRRLARAEPL